MFRDFYIINLFKLFKEKVEKSEMNPKNGISNRSLIL